METNEEICQSWLIQYINTRTYPECKVQLIFQVFFKSTNLEGKNVLEHYCLRLYDHKNN